MNVLDQIGGILQQYTGGGAIDRDQARHDYDQIAQTVPTDLLASAIGPALGSLGRQQVEERIQNSASEMTPSLRGQFLQTLLGAATGSGMNLTSVLSQLGVNPAVAQRPDQATPEDIAKLAGHVQDTKPDVFNQAMRFYSAHPTLVKVLGTVAIAKIAQHLSAQR